MGFDRECEQKLMKNRIGRLLVITDESIQSRFTHGELAALAAKGGAGMIQYREKAKTTRELIETAMSSKKICSDAGVPFIVNDRVDVALAVDADGVHLGLEDIPIPVARKLLGPEKIIGGTAGTTEGALWVQNQGADYVGFGHIYPTRSKEKPSPPVGLEVLEQTCSVLEIPVFAIGGINARNIGPVVRAGAFGAAVISAVCAQVNPEAAVVELTEAIDRALASENGKR